MELTATQKIDAQDVHDVLDGHILADGMQMVLDLEKSQGIYLHDQLTDSAYVDFFGFYASNALGMNHPKLTQDEAFRERLMAAALNKVANSDVYTPLMARFVDTFSRVGIPEYLPYAFFVSGGALAVENTLKAAFDWKVRKNFQKGYRHEKGGKVLHFDQAFHGRSGYTLSLTNTADPRKTQYFPKFDWPRIHNPKMVFPLTEDNLADLERREELALAQAKQYFQTHRDEIACVIVEPIQGEGGDNHFRASFLQAIKDLAHENDALLIFDEVQTGVGLTGAFWAHQAIGVEPDLLAFGKKTQVCGILAGRKLDEVDGHVFQTSSRINSTWGGNLVDMVRFDRILEVIEEDGLVEHAAKMGEYLQERLHALAERFPSLGNVRGLGLFCAFDAPCPGYRNRLLKECFDRKLLILGCGQKSIRFRSPLTITKEGLDEGLGILTQALEAVEAIPNPHAVG
ncbi:MAG: L-lysine 6-transaminase [Rhodothermales bacterium]